MITYNDDGTVTILLGAAAMIEWEKFWKEETKRLKGKTVIGKRRGRL